MVQAQVLHQHTCDLLIPYTPQRALRSSNQLILTVPHYRCKTKGGQAFSAVAPICNSWPVNVRLVPSLASLKSVLKYYLFSLAFD